MGRSASLLKIMAAEMISAGKFQEYPNGFGAPRPMKMGNILSAWRYEAGACHPSNHQ
jgi:hypothetical protein